VSPDGAGISSFVGQTVPLDSYIWIRTRVFSTRANAYSTLQLLYQINFNGVPGVWLTTDVGATPAAQSVMFTRHVQVWCKKADVITGAGFLSNVTGAVNSQSAEIVGWRPRPFSNAMLAEAGLHFPTRADYERVALQGAPVFMRI
jgi:hypothetical protein